MSFLKRYADNNKLPPIKDSVKKKLEDIEKNLDTKTQGDETFSDIISEYADQIVSLVARIKSEFTDWKLSVGNVTSAFRFILDIAGEVMVIVNELESKIVPPGATPEEAKLAKVAFGQELTYFVYLLWNPRLVKWIPVGIESWLEKKIIYWLSGMAVDWFIDRKVVVASTIKPKANPKKGKK